MSKALLVAAASRRSIHKPEHFLIQPPSWLRRPAAASISQTIPLYRRQALR
jgi:hypothetical protein